MEAVTDVVFRHVVKQAGAPDVFFTEFANATGTDNKELFRVPGATHIETYWKPEYVKQISEKLTDFFDRNLR